jgi:hypothetical protein
MQRRKQTLGGRIFLDRRGEIRGEALNDPLVQREAPGARGPGPAPRGPSALSGLYPDTGRLRSRPTVEERA